jgi:peptidoglycan/LPS O-acetylase OafA/YrhL
MNTLAAVPPAKKEGKGFISYIHHFRGLAIIFVAAGHLLMVWPEGSPVYRFFRVFWENGTVLFIFIAGYLFQYLSKKFEFKSYFTKKLQYVILPYFIVSIPIIIYRLMQNDYPGYIFAAHPDFLSWPAINKIVYFFLHGAHMQQLWFVPMIFCFYLIAPLLIFLDRHPRLYYLLIVFVAISCVVEREPFSDILRMFVHFISVYVFGMFLSRYRDKVLTVFKKYWIVLTVATITAIVVNYIYFEQYNPLLSYIQKMLLCCFSIYWLWRLDKYVPAFFSVLADLSFGIFFIHYYAILIIKAVYEKLMHHPIPGNIVYWIIYLVLVLLGSVLVIRAVQKLTGSKSRYLIGC